MSIRKFFSSRSPIGKIKRASGKAAGSSVVHGTATTGRVNVVRTLTMPDGQKVRVVRRDALERAISKSSE